jgi:transposase
VRLLADARQSGAKHWFVDEAHFRAEGDLRGKWVQRGQPALVDSTSPRLAEKVTYYSAVCLETGEVEALALDGYSSPEASSAFLQQLRATSSEPLVVFWDNSPTHGGDPLRTYLTTPNLGILLVRLPAYSPDYNADEAIWDWAQKRGHRQYLSGDKGGRPRAGRRLLCEFAGAQGGGQASLLVSASSRGNSARYSVVYTWVSV